MNGYRWYYICFCISIRIWIRIKIIWNMSDRIRMDIDNIQTRIQTDLNTSKRIQCRIRSENICTIFQHYWFNKDINLFQFSVSSRHSSPSPRASCWWSLTSTSDENGRKRTEKLYFYFRFYMFWWKRDCIRKMRVHKRNQNMRTYRNEQIRMESQKIKLRSHKLIFSKYTYIKSCNNIYKV
jgi:hypothetical protein